jgi:multiple sugar transport system ATP-binding protein
VEQVGSPLALYDQPANQFVAQFIGMPPMNVFAAAALPALAPEGMAAAGAFMGVRPEGVRIQPAGSGAMQGRVELVEALGADTLVYVQVDAVTSSANAEKTLTLVARQQTRTTLRVGDAVGLALDASALHRFDAEGRVQTSA